MEAGSVTFSTELDNANLDKELNDLTKKIEKTEKDILKITEKRDRAQGVLDSSELEAEKKKLEEMKAAQQELYDTDKKLESVGKKISEIEGQIAEKENARLETQKSAELGEKSIAALRERINQLQNDPMADPEIIKSQKADLELLERSWRAQQQTIKNYDQEIQSATKKLQEYNVEAKKISKAAPPDAPSDAEVAQQKEKVKELQSEWNQAKKEVTRYNTQLSDAEKELDRQKQEAGYIIQKIEESSHSANKMAQSIREARNELETLEKEGKWFGDAEYDSAYQKLSLLTDEVRKYRAELAKTPDQRQQEMDKAMRQAEEQAARMQKVVDQKRAAAEESARLKEIAENAEVSNQAVIDLSRELESLTARQKELEKAGVGIGYEEYDRISKRISEINGELREYRSNLVKTAEEEEELSKSTDTFGDRMEKLGGRIKNLASQLSRSANLAGEFGKKIIGVVKNMNVFSKLSDSLSQKFKRLGSTIKQALVFSVIYKGLATVREQMGAYLTVNTQFSTALRQLSGVLLTAFQPIYDTVLPALTALTNGVARAVAAVSQFTARLFGTTAKQSQKSTEALYNEANALEATGSAAEDAAGSLASFDEINSIQTENKGGGGGGAGAAGAESGPLFDYEYEDQPFDSWGEAFSGFLDKILGGIPKLREAFMSFADWLNDFNQKLYDMFTFPGVLDKVKQLGRDLADALNDLVNRIKWELWGRALGAGLNLALNFLTSFLYEFDWINLGEHLAYFINGLVDEIDWYEFGRLLWAGFKIAIETLAGLILGLNMPLMAEAASNIVMGFFDSMTETIQSIPWDQIGLQIAAFLTGLDWSGMFASVYNAIAAALEAIRGFLVGFLSGLGEWTQPLIDIVNTIIDTIEKMMEVTREWVSNVDFAPIEGAFESVSAAVSNLVDVLSEDLLWAYENVLLPLEGWVIEEAAPVLLEALAAAIDLLSAALEILQPVAEWVLSNVLQPIASFAWDVISTAIEGITNEIQKLTDLLNGNMTFSEFIDSLSPGEAILLGIGTALVTVSAVIATATAAVSAFSTVAGVLVTIFAALTSPIGLVVAAIAALVAGFTLLYQHSEGFREFVDGIVEEAKQLLPGVIEGIESSWDSLTKFLGEVWKGIVDGFKDFFGIHSPSTVFADLGDNLIAGLLKGISDTWKGITDFFGEKLKSIKETISDTWSKIKNTTSDTWNSIKSTLGGMWDKMKASSSTTFSNIRDKIKDVWENTRSNTSEKWNNIKSTLSSAWDSIRSTVASKFSEIKNSITSVWNSLVSSASSWGRDICSNIANGISGAIGRVTNAVSAVAEQISDFLHFSEPDVGPLSNFHTFMPDMLELMAKGIKDNTNLAVDAAADLANSVANRLNGKSIGVDISAIPDISNFSIPSIALGAAIPSNREFMSVLADRNEQAEQEAAAGVDSSEITALLQAILDAVEKGHIIMVDGQTFGRTVIKTANSVNKAAGKNLFWF